MRRICPYDRFSTRHQPCVPTRHGRPCFAGRVLRELDNGHTFAISIPVLVETVYGMSVLPRAQSNLQEWQRLRANIACYIPDEADAMIAAELRVSLRRKGWQLATNDAVVAALALRYNLTLLTTDRDFQSVPDLLTENWLAK